jgi:hypothetical protein
MFILGSKRYIIFKIVDIDDRPVTGRKLTDFSVLFLRNGAACSDALDLKELGEGRYSVTYTPSAVGNDYLELRDAANDFSVLDSEDIVDQNDFSGGSGAVSLTQHYGGTDALKVTESAPDSFTLYVFLSSDWDAGRRTPGYATGSTRLSSTGAWLSEIPVPAGTYHLVLIGFRTSKVIRPYLKVQ